MINAATAERLTINGAEIPPAPRCPDWCTKHKFGHRAREWDETTHLRGGFTARKMCEQIFLDITNYLKEQTQVAHWRRVWFDSTDPGPAEVDDRWEINGAEVTVEQLRSLVSALVPALAEDIWWPR
jgi:hypothetical protein